MDWKDEGEIAMDYLRKDWEARKTESKINTLQKLADKMGMSWNVVQKNFARYNNPKFSFICRYAKANGIPLEKLLANIAKEIADFDYEYLKETSKQNKQSKYRTH